MDDPTAPVSNRLKLFNDYLIDRKVDANTIGDNGIQLFSEINLQELSNRRLKTALCGVFIPFYNPLGEAVEQWGVRVLERRRSLAQKEPKFIMGGKDVLKNHPYFPLTNPKFSEGLDCIVTESAMKAIVLSMYNIYAIGLNGCWGFKSQHTTDRLNIDLHTIPWRKFNRVIFLPDSNWESNPMVMLSVAEFAEDLERFAGVNLLHLRLPHGPEGEWGFDDYHAHHGPDKTTEFLQSEPDPVDFSERKIALRKLNSEVCYARENNTFMNIDDNTEMNKAHFETRYSNLTYTDGENLKVATKPWMQWKHRNEAQKIVNRPGEDTYVDGNINLWRPSEVEGVEGDMNPHLDFLNKAIPDPATRLYVQQWIGHIIQHPEKKHSTALVFYSGEEGTGKTMLGQAAAGIIGHRNAMPNVSRELFAGRFNSAYTDKQLIVINETLNEGAYDAGQFMEKMKSYVTEKTLIREAKHGHAYEIDNYCNVIMTTNHITALQLSPSDRRFSIIEFDSQFRHTSEAEQRGMEMWNWHEENLPALRYFYESLDLSGFKVSSPALETTAKEEMREATMNWQDDLAFRLRHRTDDILADLELRPGIRYVRSEVLTDQAIANGFTKLDFKKEVSKKLGNALKKVGIQHYRKVYRGKQQRHYNLEGKYPNEWDMQKLSDDVDNPLTGKKYDKEKPPAD